MPGMEMRITSSTEYQRTLVAHEIGNLELKGPVVFKEYFNNASATEEAFTKDGWFRTGDQAFIDSSGHLNLMGRMKDMVIINGVKYNPEEIESAIETAEIPGVTSNFTVCFSSLRSGSQTEEIFVVYLPTYDVNDTTAHLETSNTIIRIVMIQTGARPGVIPLDSAALQKSTLGKLSRTKIKQSFERGDYNTFEEANKKKIALHRILHHQKPANATEEGLLKIFCDALQLQDQNFSVTTPIFETGITSIELIRLKQRIETHLQLPTSIPIIQLMTNPTIRSLVAALQASAVIVAYEPVVVIQPHGTKPPLWLIHPGVGEILVFLNLAKYFTDRPVYAIRARGFNKGESYFTSVADAASTYHLAIKRRQPEGPYAVAGYSYGAMLAFETAKLLERGRDEVRFVGSLNLPPHIKTRMRQLSWTECLLHLAYFLDLISERHARNLAEELHTALREEVLAHVLTSADPARLAELALTPLALVSWANLAYALQSMAVDYEPSGSVAGMEVFYCTPLAVVAASREQWLAEHLSKWKDFVRGEVGFHEVGGEHYTMLGKEHVFGFQKTLRRVLQAKGL
ncbi:Alpha/Beta hydrolase protein [Bisporella sp. PMI_857]|nr:Alpha/Beta hydrolase protein [Bisporella sp. PMI_857]